MPQQIKSFACSNPQLGQYDRRFRYAQLVGIWWTERKSEETSGPVAYGQPHNTNNTNNYPDMLVRIVTRGALTTSKSRLHGSAVSCFAGQSATFSSPAVIMTTQHDTAAATAATTTSADTTTAPAMLVPEVKRLRSLFRTRDSKEALKAGAQTYLNFMSLSSQHGWRQAYDQQARKEQLAKREGEFREAWLEGSGTGFNTVSTIGHFAQENEYATNRDASFLRTAALRYMYFTELRGVRSDTAEAWVPPRDVQVMWHAELLRPSKAWRLSKRELPVAKTWMHAEQHRHLRSGRLFEQCTVKAKRRPNDGFSFNFCTLYAPGAYLSATLLPYLCDLTTTAHPFWWLTSASMLAVNFVRNVVPWRVDEPAVKATAAIKAFDSDESGAVTKSERRDALEKWSAAQRKTAETWERLTQTRYSPHSPHSPHSPRDAKRLLRESTWDKLTDPKLVQRYLHSSVPTSVGKGGASEEEAKRRRHLLKRVDELVEAAQSQSSLVHRMLALGPAVLTADYLDRAVDRYCEFLALAAENPNQMLVPTLDIDLIWHVHMLSANDYEEDCHALLGRLLNHDAELSEAEIAGAFAKTQELYAATHGADYVLNKRAATDSGSCDSCGSCGFGGELLLHHALAHSVKSKAAPPPPIAEKEPTSLTAEVEESATEAPESFSGSDGESNAWYDDSGESAYVFDPTVSSISDSSFSSSSGSSASHSFSSGSGSSFGTSNGDGGGGDGGWWGGGGGWCGGSGCGGGD